MPDAVAIGMTRMPIELNDSARTPAISMSRCGSRWLPLTVVTRVPSAAKIEANSHPAGPLPRTRSDLAGVWDFQNVLRVVHIRVVHRKIGQTMWSGAGGEKYNLRLEHLATASGLLNLYASARKQPGSASNAIDAVSHEVALDRLGHQLGNLDLARHQ